MPYIPKPKAEHIERELPILIAEQLVTLNEGPTAFTFLVQLYREGGVHVKRAQLTLAVPPVYAVNDREEAQRRAIDAATNLLEEPNGIGSPS